MDRNVDVFFNVIIGADIEILKWTQRNMQWKWAGWSINPSQGAAVLKRHKNDHLVLSIPFLFSKMEAVSLLLSNW